MGILGFIFGKPENFDYEAIRAYDLENRENRRKAREELLYPERAATRKQKEKEAERLGRQRKREEEEIENSEWGTVSSYIRWLTSVFGYLNRLTRRKYINTHEYDTAYEYINQIQSAPYILREKACERMRFKEREIFEMFNIIENKYYEGEDYGDC